jgi:hypothetical protein
MSVIREKRDVANFDEIYLRCYGEILLDQGERESLVIEADEIILPRLSCEVADRKLVIDLKSWRDHLQSQKLPVRLEITMKEIRLISIAGSGTLLSDGIRSDQLHLLVSGSANGAVNRLVVGDFKVTIPGSCRMEIAGEVNSHEVHISGSAKLKEEHLTCQTAEVRISGSADVDLFVTKKLTIGISGSGTVRYRGNPEISQRISGAGEVIALS